MKFTFCFISFCIFINIILLTIFYWFIIFIIDLYIINMWTFYSEPCALSKHQMFKDWPPHIFCQEIYSLVNKTYEKSLHIMRVKWIILWRLGGMLDKVSWWMYYIIPGVDYWPPGGRNGHFYPLLMHARQWTPKEHRIGFYDHILVMAKKILIRRCWMFKDSLFTGLFLYIFVFKVLFNYSSGN